MNPNLLRLRRAFTLVELLVVISIIALLAAILFPVFGRVRERARQTGCASNMKQISMALKQYAIDYENTYPTRDIVGASVLRAADDPQSLPSILNPYLKNKQVFVCPSGREELMEVGNTYSYFLSASTATNGFGSVDNMEANSPDTLLLFDAYPYASATPEGETGNPKQVASSDRHCPHFRNFQQLFLDGHVKRYSQRLANNICPAK